MGRRSQRRPAPRHCLHAADAAQGADPDEATSNIDTRTEQLVQQALDTLLEGHTAFVIAHRLTTICRADKIVVMGDGGILEQGSHEALMALDGHYQYTAAGWILSGVGPLEAEYILSSIAVY